MGRVAAGAGFPSSGRTGSGEIAEQRCRRGSARPERTRNVRNGKSDEETACHGGRRRSGSDDRGPPGSAAASASAWCQSSYLVYKYWKSDGSIGSWSKNCSGDYSLNSKGYKLEPGGWSGYIDYSDGTWDYFCDFQNKWLGKRVVKITMAAAKIEYCVNK
ncbi:hypothetical protein [Nonomuraea sp. NPDC049646]|uniref:hypothetical protein n=1 Tax=unclassified Nonomuraea TaxID=2593643 RepID=UPI0037943E56